MKQADSQTLVQQVIFTTDQGPGQSWISEYMFTPVLAQMMQNRRIILILAGVAVLQVWLTSMSLWAWQCPIKSSLGIKVPGLRVEYRHGLINPGGVARCNVRACVRARVFSRPRLGRSG